jgi:hypothetical protein
MRLRRGLLVVAVCVSTFLLLAPILEPFGSGNYAKENQKALRSLFGDQFKGYYFRASPLGNFGVGSMYLDEPSVPVENRWLVGHPDTWFIDTLSVAERQRFMDRIVVRGELGSRSLDESWRGSCNSRCIRNQRFG